MRESVSILEVGPRDGLQNEKILPLNCKYDFIQKLSRSGLRRIEIGSFVSPEWIPQMQDTPELSQKVLKAQRQGQIPKKVKFSALVPNFKGLKKALNSGLREISVFLSATDSFSKKNLNRSMEESYLIYKKVCREALKENLKIRAYLSVCFDCPYEGKVPIASVLEWVKKIEDLSVYEISISDTTGRARAWDVQTLLEKLFRFIPKNKIAGHFHDVHGMALPNILMAYQMGVRSFDGSAGGLGGCPYSKTPSGNAPTEAIIYLLKDPTDPTIKNLVKISLWLEKKLGKKLPSAFLHVKN